MKYFTTINLLPPDERVHALFIGQWNGCCCFEVTGRGTLLVPGNRLLRLAGLGRMAKGEDVNLKRDSSAGNVSVWRVK